MLLLGVFTPLRKGDAKKKKKMPTFPSKRQGLGGDRFSSSPKFPEIFGFGQDPDVENARQENEKIEREREQARQNDRKNQAIDNARNQNNKQAQSTTKRDDKEPSLRTSQSAVNPSPTLPVKITELSSAAVATVSPDGASGGNDSFSTITNTAGPSPTGNEAPSSSISSGLTEVSSRPKGVGKGNNNGKGNGSGSKRTGKVLNPKDKAYIAIGSILCFILLLALVIFIVRKFRSRRSRYGSSSSYISSNKSVPSRRSARMSRDRQMEESLFEDELQKNYSYDIEVVEKPRPAVSRWMSEVRRHQLTDPARVSVSLPTDGARSRGQAADISDVSSLLTTAVTPYTHSIDGNFKPITALRHPNLPQCETSLTQPFHPKFSSDFQAHWRATNTSSTPPISTSNDVLNPIPAKPLAVRLSGVGVKPPTASLEHGNQSRDSVETFLSSISAKEKRRSI